MRTPAVLIFLIGVVLMPSLSAAQAWTPPAGSGSLSVAAQDIENTGHRLADGSLDLVGGQSRNVSIFLEAEYALTDRWSISLGLPYVFSRYTGVDTPRVTQPVDLCHCWNSAWQDLAFTTRYSLAKGPTGVTPFIAVGAPSHDYVYRGEAVVGRQLREARLGVAAGRRLDGLSSRLSVEGSYSYSIVEQVLDVPNNRSNVTLEVAALAWRKVSVRGFGAWQRTHGGLRAQDLPFLGFPFGDFLTLEVLNQHDRLMRDNNFRAGGAAAFPLSRVDVFASYVHYVSGTSTHTGFAVTTGLSFPFEWHPGHNKPAP